jgi:hypothetical protein
MGISGRVRSLRMDEEESGVADFVQDKFWPFTQTFKDTVMLCLRLVKHFIVSGSLGDIVEVCQRIRGTTSSTQMKLSFPPAEGHSFFPRISNRMEAE